MRFKHTIPCSRPGQPAEYDDFGNLLQPEIPALSFAAVFVPPTTQAGSQIVDDILRQTTVTKPTLYVDRRADNAATVAVGAIVSGDSVTVNGEPDWEVDGDPGQFKNPFTGHQMPLVIELRKAAG